MTVNEVSRKIKNRKAAGLDEIPPEGNSTIYCSNTAMLYITKTQ